MSLRHQFLRFAAVGAMGTLAQYLTLWVGVERLGMSAAGSSGLGYLLGSVVNYLLNHAFTFGSDEAHVKAVPKFYAVVAIGWCINTGIMWLLTQYLLWHYWWAQLFATGAGLVWNFTGSKWWVFKPAGVTND